MAEGKRRTYKRFLESCEIEDVDDAVFRRTKRKFLFQQKQQVRNESIRSHVGNATEVENNIDEIHESLDLNTDSSRTLQIEVCSNASDFEQWDATLLNELTNSINDDELNDGQRQLLNPSSLHDFMQNEKFLQSITTPVDKSPGEIFLMILRFGLSGKLPFTYISTMCSFVNTIFTQSILPETRYILDKILNTKSNLEFHGICPNCSIYIGKLKDEESFVVCGVCSETVNLKHPSCSNVFVFIDPSESIKNLLNDNYDYYNYIMKVRKYDGKIKDIFDGKYYRSFVKTLPKSERNSYVTAVFNTDGAPRFESSQYSIWPIYLMLNELPLSIRFNSLITCCMWFGRDKPPMHAFLEPFVSSMNHLSNEGIKCELKGEERVIKVYPLCACVDSVARAPMQGMKQFNAHHGCNWCLHEGEWYARSMRYPVGTELPAQRTMKNSLEFMERYMEIIEATESDNEPKINNVFGINNASPLINLNSFNIIKGFVPDYMHCYLAGVGQQITECLLHSISKTEIESLNITMQNIKVPHQLARLARPLKDRSYWKAREWENFILYYSLPLFETVLAPDLLEYWKLLVNSLYILLKEEITYEELNYADELLYEFNFLTEHNFTKKNMTYNIHQLLHLCQSVADWGPLWCHSTFAFESANNQLLQAIHCAKGVNLQIVRYINIQRCTNILENSIFPHASVLIKKFCEYLTLKRLKKSLKIENTTYLGNTKTIDKNILEQFGLSVEKTLVFERIVINGCLYASQTRKNIRSDNSFAQLNNGLYIRIMYFVIDTNCKTEGIICRICNVSSTENLCNTTFLVINIENNLILVNSKDLKKICALIKVNEKSYITALPNVLHY